MVALAWQLEWLQVHQPSTKTTRLGVQVSTVRWNKAGQSDWNGNWSSCSDVAGGVDHSCLPFEFAVVEAEGRCSVAEEAQNLRPRFVPKQYRHCSVAVVDRLVDWMVALNWMGSCGGWMLIRLCKEWNVHRHPRGDRDSGASNFLQPCREQ